jgi:hypothetical protein
MQDARRREDKTVDIATALFLVVGLVLAGGLALWLFDLWPGGLGDYLFLPLVVVATAVAVRYLLTRRR